MTLLLSSAIVVDWGLDRKDRGEVTGDIIETILIMIIVWVPYFSFIFLNFLFEYTGYLLQLLICRKEVRTSSGKEWKS